MKLQGSIGIDISNWLKRKIATLLTKNNSAFGNSFLQNDFENDISCPQNWINNTHCLLPVSEKGVLNF